MLVRDRMTARPVTITGDVTVLDAINLMTEKGVRHLPVTNRDGRLIGIVSEKELLKAAPSPVTSLNVWEVKEMLHLLTINKIMSVKLTTIEEEAPLEEAAVVMVANKMDGLPVTHKGVLAGVITETDIFKSFLELLGAKRHGVRITVVIPGERGLMAKTTNAIFEVGGNIMGLGLMELKESPTELWEITFKVQGVTKEKLMEGMKPFVKDVVDLRDQ
jgi:acetoin utilization protein AcuB